MQVPARRVELDLILDCCGLFLEIPVTGILDGRAKFLAKFISLKSPSDDTASAAKTGYTDKRRPALYEVGRLI